MSGETYRAVNATAVGELVEAAAAAGVRRVVHCSTVGVHGDIEHPPANEDAPLKPGDIYQDTKLEGERLAREAGARLGIEVTIARPTGIYGPGDRRLLKLFRGVARRRWFTLGRGEIYYHLTYIDDLVEGFRLCGEHPAAANRTYILAGGEVTTLNELVALIAEVRRRAGAARCICRSGRSGWPAPRAKRSACRSASSRRIYRRRVDFFTKSRAFDITRARSGDRLRAAASACAKASRARWTGIAAMAGCDGSRPGCASTIRIANRQGAGPALRAGHVEPCEVRGARRRPARDSARC